MPHRKANKDVGTIQNLIVSRMIPIQRPTSAFLWWRPTFFGCATMDAPGNPKPDRWERLLLGHSSGDEQPTHCDTCPSMAKITCSRTSNQRLQRPSCTAHPLSPGRCETLVRRVERLQLSARAMVPLARLAIPACQRQAVSRVGVLAVLPSVPVPWITVPRKSLFVNSAPQGRAAGGAILLCSFATPDGRCICLLAGSKLPFWYSFDCPQKSLIRRDFGINAAPVPCGLSPCCKQSGSGGRGGQTRANFKPDTSLQPHAHFRIVG
jgi:hypothetical protein